MINTEPVSAEVVSCTDPQNVIAALKRLRNSYKARPVTGADRAVLSAVRSILKNATSPQDPA
jgi:hypothetical protein